MDTLQDRRTLRRLGTKEEILGAALELMARDGVAGLSLSSVARRVGMKPPSLYEYFPAKMALYDALFARGASELYEAVRAAGSNPALAEDPLAALRAGARAYLSWSLANPVLAQLLNWRPVPGFTPSAAAFAPSLDMIAAMRTLMGAAVERGMLKPEAASEEALLLFTAVIAGVVSQQLANEPLAASETGRYAALLDPAVTLWLEHYTS